MITKNHQFFLLNYRPWPLISSINSFSVFLSGLVFLKFGRLEPLAMRILTVSMSSFIWWRFYRGEFNVEGKNSFRLEQGIKYSILLFISSEIFFFFSFFWAYFHFYLSPCIEVSIVWPPLKARIFDYLNVPLINTLVLIRSGFTVTVSHYFLTRNCIRISKIFLLITVILGLIFSMLQLIEYERAMFSISDARFGRTFFILTGFHGIHVIIGTTFLLACLYRYHKITPHNKECLSIEIAAWYWHFVDVVWIFLYFTLYYMNN